MGGGDNYLLLEQDRVTGTGAGVGTEHVAASTALPQEQREIGSPPGRGGKSVTPP
jgi:hypothetical protein